MAFRLDKREGSSKKNTSLLLLFFAVACLFFAISGARAQNPSPSPSPSGEKSLFHGFDITSSIEVGVRGVSVVGNDNKYRSDFNYRPGVRIFDSSFLMEDRENKHGFFDSLLVTASGFRGDPSGFARINMAKTGFYTLDAKIRQVLYYNNLNNHARNAHTADTNHKFGDFDLTIFPQNERLRFRVGASYNRTNGAGGFTTRAYSDEYPISSKVDNGSNDFRAGIDGKLLGFNLSLSYGYRQFKDSTEFITKDNAGFNTTNTARINTFERSYPINGDTHYGLFNAQRTFAEKLDFTARVITSVTERRFNYLEIITGRDNSNNIVDSDRFEIGGDSKRPQTRGDLGLTYAVTDKFRISETFSFDTFNISGGTAFAEALFTRNSAGGARPTVFTNTLYHRVTGFRRFVNTVEGDYQFNDRFAFNLGYRYSNRRIDLLGFNQTLPPATTPTRTLIEEEEKNQNNSIIAGMKAKPMKNWTIYGDLESGDADNAFTRLANYKYTNLRLRSRMNFNRFAINFSAITKDNENPSTSTAPQGNVSGDFVANVKSRIFSAFVDWTPNPYYSFNVGYTFQHLTSETDIVINTGTLVRGQSQFYMRDHYAFIDVSARPLQRVSVFASYRFSNDTGQGDRTTTLPQVLITSYPFRLHSPEARVAIRLTKNIDWNIGYQYLDYAERFQPLSVGGSQNYRAHLPYTSLRIYFGGGGEDRGR